MIELFTFYFSGKYITVSLCFSACLSAHLSMSHSVSLSLSFPIALAGPDGWAVLFSAAVVPDWFVPQCESRRLWWWGGSWCLAVSSAPCYRLYIYLETEERLYPAGRWCRHSARWSVQTWAWCQAKCTINSCCSSLSPSSFFLGTLSVSPGVEAQVYPALPSKTCGYFGC